MLYQGAKDSMAGMDETKNYINYAKESSCDITVVEAKGRDHGMKQIYYMNDYLTWLKKIFD